MINTFLLIAIGILAISIVISMHAAEDFELDDADFKAQLDEMFKDQP